MATQSAQTFFQRIEQSFMSSIGAIVFGTEDGTVSIFGLVRGNRGLWALRIPLEHPARLFPDMFSLAHAHQAFDSEGRIASYSSDPMDGDDERRRVH